MVTQRSQRMAPVRRIAGERADKAARQYAAERERLDHERERLAQLRGFRREYEQKFSVAGGSGIGGYRLRDYNAFLARIDSAIAEQQRRLEGIEAEADSRRDTWLKEWGNAQALERLVARYRAQERQVAEQREQRQLDEQAQRCVARAHGNGG